MKANEKESGSVKQNKKNTFLDCLAEAALYAAAFLVTLFLFFTCKPYYHCEGVADGTVAQTLTAVLIGTVLCVADI